MDGDCRLLDFVLLQASSDVAHDSGCGCHTLCVLRRRNPFGAGGRRPTSLSASLPFTRRCAWSLRAAAAERIRNWNLLEHDIAVIGFAALDSQRNVLTPCLGFKAVG